MDRNHLRLTRIASVIACASYPNKQEGRTLVYLARHKNTTAGNKEIRSRSGIAVKGYVTDRHVKTCLAGTHLQILLYGAYDIERKQNGRKPHAKTDEREMPAIGQPDRRLPRLTRSRRETEMQFVYMMLTGSYGVLCNDWLNIQARHQLNQTPNTGYDILPSTTAVLTR